MREMSRNAVIGMIFVIGLVSIGLSLKTSHDKGETNDKLIENQKCLTGYIAENSRVTKLRSTATAEATLATDKVINGMDTVFKGVRDLTVNPSDQETASRRYRMLLSDYGDKSDAYKRASAKLKKKRAENPLPELPATCSEVK